MENTSRRIAGVVFGALLALAYAAVSQLINAVVLPGIPFYRPPFGAVGNIVFFTLLGALLGLLTAWLRQGLVGISIVSLVCSIALLAVGLQGATLTPQNTGGVIVGLLFMLFPFFGLFFVPLGIFRWALDKEEETRADREPFWVFLRWPVLLLLVAAGVGYLSLYPSDGQSVLTRMNDLMQAGLRAGAPPDLPKPLQAEGVGDWKGNAVGEYGLEWTFSNLGRFKIPYSLSSGNGYPSAALAHFQSGWTLVCLYPHPQAEPSCRAFTGGSSPLQDEPLGGLLPISPLPR